MAAAHERGTIRFTYDPEADAVAIHLHDTSGRIETLEISTDHLADFDRRGNLVGLEILNASQHYGRGSLKALPSPVDT